MTPSPAESVWDYPRPPRLEPSSSHVQVVHQGVVLVDTRQSLRLLETSHPPVFYLPPADVRLDLLRPAGGRPSFCEFKGLATYFDLLLPDQNPLARVAWAYPKPSPAYAGLQDFFAFYPSRVELCLVDGERVQAQPGDFYGGWITSGVRGPFKGGPGTLGW